MAERGYTLVVKLSRGTRKSVFAQIALIFEHLDALDADLVSFTLLGDTITIVLSKPIAAEQAQHLGLT